MEDLKITSSEKCPLCGGDVILGECSFCGYTVPDTEKLSATYDMSPDNVIFGEYGEYEDGDELLSIDPPDAASLPTAEQIRDAAKRRRAAERLKNSQGKNPYGAKNTNSASPANIANNANAAFVPYTKPDYGNRSEPADTSDIPTMAVKAVSDFVVKNWWKFLLTAILPSVGYAFAFFYVVINMDKDRKKDELFFAGAILLTAIILQAVGWDPTGFDILIRYFMMEILTRGRYHRYRY